MTGKLILNQEGFSEQMLADIAFTPENLDKAFVEQASLFCFYAEQSRTAQKKMDNFKLKIDIVESELDKEIRNEAIAHGLKITEKAIEQSINRNEKYVSVVMAYNDAKATSQMLRDILDAFKMRKDMLYQIGMTRRDEAKASGFRLSETERDEAQNDLKARRDSLFAQRNMEEA